MRTDTSGTFMALIASVGLLLACFPHPASAWAGQGVIAVYVQVPPEHIHVPLTVSYCDYLANNNSRKWCDDPVNISSWGFWGPLPRFHQKDWKYAEVPSNGASLRFYGALGDGGSEEYCHGSYYVKNPGTYEFKRNGSKMRSDGGDGHHDDVKYDVTQLQSFQFGCPGEPPTDPMSTCSSHGSCDLLTFECTCDPDYNEPACEGDTKCDVQFGTDAHGTGLIKSSSVYTATECCTKCAMGWSPCEVAVFDAKLFECTLIGNVTKIYNSSESSRAIVRNYKMTTPPTALPTPHPDSSPSNDDPSITHTPTFYVLISVLPLITILLGVLLINSVTKSRKDRARRGEHNPLLINGDPASISGAGGAAAAALYGGKYRVIRILGRGSFGVVYLVAKNDASPLSIKGNGVPTSGSAFSLDTINERELLAMKVIHCHSEEEMMNAFREFKSLNDLQGHPGIATLVDMFMGWEAPQMRSSSGAPIGPNSYRSMDNFAVGSDGDTPPGADTPKNTPPLRPVRSPPSLRSPPKSPMKSNGVSRQNSGTATTIEPPRSLMPQDHIGEDSDEEHHEDVATRYLCLVMEYYAEGNLESAVSRDPSYFREPEVVISIASQVFGALCHSHRKSIIHRDLKPGNILLSDRRTRAVVTDFGLARDLSGTSTTAAGGTLHYLAPEQVDHRCSKKTDVWSAACVIVAMATGHVGGRVRALFMMRVEPNFEADLREELTHLPEYFVDLLISMLAASPIDRPSFEDCCQVLDDALASHSASGDGLADREVEGASSGDFREREAEKAE